MSLTDKVIKNTYYYVLSQIISFIFPLFLTPFIISKIGQVEFGIYTLVLGFTLTFGIFDLSLSSSFIKFISEYYHKRDNPGLNSVINTGLLFYVCFSALCVAIGFVFTGKLLALINISGELYGKAFYAFRISLLIFMISNSFSIFSSILISLQKMYLSSIYNTIFNALNFVAIIFLLSRGYGLIGLMYSQLALIATMSIASFIISKRELPEMKISPVYFRKKTLKEMSVFGLQIQLSKLASFASEKYDEFLLAYFSVLNNVTFYNLSSRVVRLGRFLPYQLVPQVAPVAAEINAKEGESKLAELFRDTSKYLTLASLPVFIFVAVFSDMIILAWMDKGYELSSYLLRILAIGNLANMILSAPGNSITPNIGIPKYQMREGLINLSINLVVSYLLIRYLGIIGAAIGNSGAMLISSLYVFLVSTKLFNRRNVDFIKEIYLKPLISSVLSAGIVLCLYYVSSEFVYKNLSRVTSIVYLITSVFLFSILFSFFILNLKYITRRDKQVFVKLLMKAFPLRFIVERRNKMLNELLPLEANYNNELISIFIVTYNRLEMLKKCYESLLPTLKDINYQLIFWNNNSNDGTREFLESLSGNTRIEVVNYDRNIGTNAKGLAAELCKGEYLVGIDDDVIDFPKNWLKKMFYAYNSIPGMAYLASDVVQDDKTNGAKFPPDQYDEESFKNGEITLQHGLTGGWCFMISNKIYERVGKFVFMKNRIFFSEDGDYLNRAITKGYKFGILKDVKVYHATGDFYNIEHSQVFRDKMRDYYRRDIPFHYRLKTIFNQFLSIRRSYYKLLNSVEQIMSQEK